MYIPLTKPFWGKKEEKAVINALRLTNGAGDGPFSKKLVGKLQRLTRSRFVLPVTSCTHGLELAMVALKETKRFKTGDEIIVPSYTMTSTANAILLSGGTPVFADIEENFYCIDPADIRKKITKKTRGLIIVHYAGMSCDMKPILALAKSHNLFIIEDAAHAIGASQNIDLDDVSDTVSKSGNMLRTSKKPSQNIAALGTFGDIGVYSFHGTKNITCGEGGVVLTNNPKLADVMEIYRANGTNRASFLAGIVDKYSWVGLGTSYFLSDILSSIVCSQLDQINYITKKRNQIASFYTKSLQEYQSLIKLPEIPIGCNPNYHIYAIRFYEKRHRDIFLDRMRKKGIDVSSHYVPLHSSKMGKRLYSGKGIALFGDTRQWQDNYLGPFPSSFSEVPLSNKNRLHRKIMGGTSGAPHNEYPYPLKRGIITLPVTEKVWQTLVRLPIYPSLTQKELRFIVTCAKDILRML